MDFFACELAGDVVTFFCVPETRGADADAIDYEEYKASLGIKELETKNLEETDEPAEEMPSR